MTNIDLRHGDCLDVLAELADCSVDAVVTDPPYGLANTDPAHVADTIVRWVNGDRDYLPGGAGFMGKAWDAFVPPVAVWDECLRVLKPGGHVLAFAGSRTVDLMTLGLRLAGFDIRDSIAWLYGSGFPKSLDVSKAIDKRPGVMRHAEFAQHLAERRTAAGMSRADVSERVVGTRTGACWNWEHHQFPEAKWWPALRDLLGLDEDTWGPVIAEAERQKIGTRAGNRLAVAPGQGMDRSAVDLDVTTHATDAARTWQGWGTALKPAHEPLVCARKPLDASGILARIGSQLEALEATCRQRASGAARSSAPTRPDSPEATTDSAPASAATPPEAGPEAATATGRAAGSSAATGTSASELTVETFLNTVTSWRACWVELCDLTNTSTTSTATSRTTDLTTLSSCLSSLMQSVTAQSTPEPRSWSSLVTAADNLFAAGVLNLRSTLALSAVESATASTPQASPDAAGSSPAFEPIVVARKPLHGTVAANVLQHGTGALNIDACRVGTDDDLSRASGGGGTFTRTYQASQGYRPEGESYAGRAEGSISTAGHAAGRWPANVVLDETQATALDQQSGETVSRAATTAKPMQRQDNEVYGKGLGSIDPSNTHTDTGGASRFFYVAKADASERVRVNGTAHPTVKPLALMRWLVRLVTPPGGTVLEPFAGSGTTVEACILEGFSCVAIEREADYLPLIRQRIARRRDPVEAVKATGDDGGLFDLLEGESA